MPFPSLQKTAKDDDPKDTIEMCTC